MGERRAAGEGEGGEEALVFEERYTSFFCSSLRGNSVQREQSFQKLNKKNQSM